MNGPINAALAAERRNDLQRAAGCCTALPLHRRAAAVAASRDRRLNLRGLFRSKQPSYAAHDAAHPRHPAGTAGRVSAAVSPVETVRSTDDAVIAFHRLGDGPPVIAVHGGLGTAASWCPVAERLSDRCQFLLLDRRGRGQSGKGDGAHSLQAEVDDVRAVMQVVGPSAVLLGHSFGGAVTLEAARVAAPGEVAAVAVYEPAVGIGGLIASSSLDQLDELVHVGQHAHALEYGFAQLDAAGLVAHSPLAAGARRSQALLDMAWTVGRELRAADALGGDLSRYAALDLPALVLAGESSPPRQRELCQQLADILPHGWITWLPALGHVAHTAAPDVVAAALAPFLDAVGHAGDTST